MIFLELRIKKGKTTTKYILTIIRIIQKKRRRNMKIKNLYKRKYEWILLISCTNFFLI
jgi:hypothetical protein